MSPFVLAAVSSASAVVAWLLAADALRRRGYAPGGPPLGCLLLVIAVAAIAGPPYDVARFVVLGGVVAAAICDARTGLIVRPLTSFVALTALAISCVEDHARSAGGAITVGGTLLALHLATGGRAVGLGDVRLGLAVGAGLGAIDGARALGYAFALGGAFAALQVALKRARAGDTVRFAPFVAAGVVIVFLPVDGLP
jgi:prepilin signal peptidase PulO-like enzyme (type II secretory pathway)